VAYDHRPETGTEASKEATRKRKYDACAGPVGKWMKRAGKKKAAAPKAAAAPKGTSAALSRATSAPQKLHRRLVLHRGMPLKKLLQ
jgi:hypothetical protein